LKIGVIGLGTVGSAMHELFGRAASIVTYDPRQHDDYPERELGQCEFAVVCVDTPNLPDGTCDTRNVIDALGRLPVDRVLLRSTVAPGTTSELEASTGKQVCFWPELLGETSYSEAYWTADERSVPFAILGGARSTRQYFADELLPALGPSKTFFLCTALEAELIKYMENSFLATKVTFVNEFYEICRTFGADWHTVREGWLLDPRAGRSHSAVFASERGFAGKCLPKDVRAVVRAAAEAGYSAQLLAEVLDSNDRFRKLGEPPA